MLFVVWYPGSFLLYIAYNVTKNGVMYVALNAFYPLVIFVIAFLYFRKSINDWNDRFAVAFGWTVLMFLIAALLVEPVYGFSWTSILNISQIESNWSPFLAALLAGILVRISKNPKK